MSLATGAPPINALPGAGVGWQGVLSTVIHSASSVSRVADCLAGVYMNVDVGMGVGVGVCISGCVGVWVWGCKFASEYGCRIGCSSCVWVRSCVWM